MTDRNLDLDKIRRRYEAATPEPWITGDRYRPGGLHAWEVVIGHYPVLEIENSDQGRADAQFIAHAHEDVRALLAEVERLKANQQPDGDGDEDDDAPNLNVTRVSVPSHTIVLTGRVPKTEALDQAQAFYRDEIAYAHTALIELEKGLATVSWPESESKPSDTRPESTTDQTAPQTP